MLEKFIPAVLAVFLVCERPAPVFAQTPPEPVAANVELTEVQQQALIAMAVAIDESSVEDLVAALVALNCGNSCGTFIDGQLFLHRAARDSTPNVIAVLALAGANIDHLSPPLAWTPLLVALNATRTENATTLIELGADTSIVGLDGSNAPFMADLLGLGELIPYPPVQLSAEDANRTLLLAIEANNLDAVRFALQAGADPGTTAPENGWSALMIASFNGYFSIIEELLDERYGSYTDLVRYSESSSGLNALHAAVIGFPEGGDNHQYACVIGLLRTHGVPLFAETNEGLTVQDIANNIKLNSMVRAPLFSSVHLREDCMPTHSDEETFVELVDANPEPTEIASVAAVPDQNDLTQSQVELVMSLQRGLDEHNCRPGPVDGSYGQRSARAADLFNLVRPSSCSALLPLDSIGRSQPSEPWRAAATANIDTLVRCNPSPACGTAPSREHYREFSRGCWYKAEGELHPSEYATWDQECDSDGFITGKGTLTFHYPEPVPNYYAVTKTGSFVRGTNDSNGLMILTLLNGTVLYYTYMNGQLVDRVESLP